MRSKLGRQGERLATVDELIRAIMEANVLAKAIPCQDERHAEIHAKIDSLLDELDVAR